jgi:uncharacterized membrane protein YjjP (DUF1212 family)
MDNFTGWLIVLAWSLISAAFDLLQFGGLARSCPRNLLYEVR